ncbi:hypothetical protein J6R97_05135 [bacterium]|nr:hypothetical protein [bacterium]
MRPNLSVSYNVNFQANWYDKFFKRIPNKDVVNASQFNEFGKKLASPHWNRLALGVAGIATYPFWDYYNPKIDRDTAKASTIRTSSKIVTCTATGFVIRGLCYKLTEKYMHGSTMEGSTLLTPKSILEEVNADLRNNKLKLHKNTFSTVIALFVMLFTNFLIDAPLTTIVTNKFLRLANLENKARAKNERVI